MSFSTAPSTVQWYKIQLSAKSFELSDKFKVETDAIRIKLSTNQASRVTVLYNWVNKTKINEYKECVFFICLRLSQLCLLFLTIQFYRLGFSSVCVHVHFRFFTKKLGQYSRMRNSFRNREEWLRAEEGRYKILCS